MIETKDLVTVWNMIGMSGECPYESLRELQQDKLGILPADSKTRLTAILKIAETLSDEGMTDE